MTTAPSERHTMSWLKIISGRGRDGRCDVMEAGGHVGTQGDMYRLCDIGEARLERQSSMSYAEQVWEAARKTSLHETLLVCVLPAHADNRLCGILLETRGGKAVGAKRQEQEDIAPIVTTKGKMRRCRVWLPCSMGAAGTRAWSPWQNHSLVSNVTTSWTRSQWPTTFTSGNARRGPLKARAKARCTSCFKFDMSGEDDTGHVLEWHKIEEQIAEERVRCRWVGQGIFFNQDTLTSG